jgi:hypothetical protein
MTSVRLRRTGRAAEPAPFRRSYTAVRNWAEFMTDLGAHGWPRVVLADVDPGVAGWGADAARLADGFARIEPVMSDVSPAGTTFVWTSHTTRVADEFRGPPHRTPGGNRLLLGVRKPRLKVLRRELPDLPRGPQTVVVGDQWLIDGLLAWRLGARFILWIDARPTPRWAEAQRLVGLMLVRPFYRRR